MKPVGNFSPTSTSTLNPSGPAGPVHTAPARVDPRGLRFAAALTTAVLATVLLTQSSWLLAAQVAVFAVGAFIGLRRSPYAIVFARLVRPRIGAPGHTEDARPPQFAQLVGFGFAAVGLVAFVAGAITVALVAVGLALAAAFLNAAFGLCLGCELYLSALRLTQRRHVGQATTAPSVP
ncbi:MAG: DUF4395 domain-containing protein [Nocardioidaceae bacterium]